MSTQQIGQSGIAEAPAGQALRALRWVLLALLAALLAFLVRGYLNPELLFHFANGLYC